MIDTEDRKTLREVPYPYNFIEAVSRSKRDSGEGYYIRSDEYTPASIRAMIAEVLTEREQQIVEMHYRDNLSLAAIGKIFDVTPERIRQLEAKALRKISGPNVLKRYAAVPWVVWREEHLAREKAEQRLDYFLQHADYKVPIFDLSTKQFKSDDEPKTTWEYDTDILNMSIDELDLSVRSWKCLRQAGIDTVGQLTDKTFDELAAIRNLGKRSMEEIIEKLSALGVSLNHYTYTAK